MDSWHNYPSIFNLGHKAVADLLSVPVNVEEKIDGSQFSFGVDENGELHIRSKGATINVDAPDRMFLTAVTTAKELTNAQLLHPGWTYRCEYLTKPKHNCLAYNRVPFRNLIIFDINRGHEDYLSYPDKNEESFRLSLETVPLLFCGMLTDIESLKGVLQTESCLGGPKIEGVVIKPTAYNLFGEDKKVLMGKFVSEEFKEIHTREWKNQNPSSVDILTSLGLTYKTNARWEKAVQHLRDGGTLKDSPTDIGALLKEVILDVEKECRDEIIQKLWAWAWPHLRRKVTAGLPEWYKDGLLQKQFDNINNSKEEPIEYSSN